MTNYKLAFLGFGNVGQALADLLSKKKNEIVNNYDINFSVTGIATGRHGMAIDPNGIELSKVCDLAKRDETITSLNRNNELLSAKDFIQKCRADVMFESIPVNYENGQPAVDLIRSSLEAGLHTVSANKGPVVHAYQELTSLAKTKGIKYYFESAVMDGAPIFGLFRETLPAATVLSIHGVLNSTTNLILSRMEKGESFDQAIAYTRSLGISETDPSGDIDGWDAAVKLCALVTVLMKKPITPQEISRTGIRGITLDEIRKAQSEGLRWKLICEAKWDGNQLKTSVSPEKVEINSPFYRIDGTTSIVQIESDVLGRLTFIEENPGTHTTAYGMLADFLNIVRKN
jgi:homoserine dehydrogenase